MRAAKSFINLLPTRWDSVPRSWRAEIKPVPENRLQPAFQVLQENTASEKVGNMVVWLCLLLGWVSGVLSLALCGKGLPSHSSKHRRAVFSQTLPWLSSVVGSDKSIWCYLPAALPSSLLKSRQTERFTSVLPIVSGFYPLHEV